MRDGMWFASQTVPVPTVILAARKLQPLLEDDFAAGKSNMATEFWAEVYTKHAVDWAAHILDLIDKKWPTIENLAVGKKGV